MKKIRNILPYMAYGDALGFLRENVDHKNYSLQPFTYTHSPNISLKEEKGQWSYITQLALINCKCFIDHKENMQVSIDYKRMAEEIKLWINYRCGSPANYIYKLQLGKNYYSSDFYWNDTKGEAFSRVIPIAVVNKNFKAAQDEVYKNIIYINRHPQVIFSGLLLLRTIHLLLNNVNIGKEDLINGLKSYLINLQLLELEENMRGQVPCSYKIRFEQEKINYLIELDKARNVNIYNGENFTSRYTFLTALTLFLHLSDSMEDINTLSPANKEIYAITYALFAIRKDTDQIRIGEIKDSGFIRNMGEYLLKLREYEIGRTYFKKDYGDMDIFTLEKGMALRHPILNSIRVKEKKEFSSHIEMIIDSKSGEYRFIKEKN